MAHVVRVADTYVEVHFSGELDRATMQRDGARLSAEEMSAVQRTGKVLFDFTDVESFGFETQPLGMAMQRLAGNGVRLAINSSNPRFFAIGRQIALHSGLEGSAIAVFADRVEALSWLLDRHD